jgi:hypothetical protein
MSCPGRALVGLLNAIDEHQEGPSPDWHPKATLWHPKLASSFLYIPKDVTAINQKLHTIR